MTTPVSLPTMLPLWQRVSPICSGLSRFIPDTRPHPVLQRQQKCTVWPLLEAGGSNPKGLQHIIEGLSFSLKTHVGFTLLSEYICSVPLASWLVFSSKTDALSI